MKRTGLLLLLFISFSTITHARQYTTEKVKAGVYVTAGLNYAGAAGWENPAESGAQRIAGFNTGLSFFALMGKNARTILNIEGYFSQQGFGNKEATSDDDIKKLYINYINVPVILKYRPIRSFQSFFVGAGPQIGFQVGGHGKTLGGEKFELNQDAITKNVWSGVSVVGFNFDRVVNFGVEFSYQHSFSRFLETNPDLRHSVMQARLILPLDFVSDMLSAFQ
ncbi:MAG: outer membrane beta-barrel protein [Chitinophagaceae bacterium]